MRKFQCVICVFYYIVCMTVPLRKTLVAKLKPTPVLSQQIVCD